MVHVHVGDAEVSGAQGSGLNSQTLGIHLVVDVENLGKPGKPQPALQELVAADVRGPAHTCHLRTGWRSRVEEILLQCGIGGQPSKRRPALEAIAEDIADCQRIIVVQLVVKLHSKLIITCRTRCLLRI